MRQLRRLLTSCSEPPCICAWRFQNSRFLFRPSGRAPQCTILVLHAALPCSQDEWPEHGALLESVLFMGNSFHPLEDSSRKEIKLLCGTYLPVAFCCCCFLCIPVFLSHMATNIMGKPCPCSLLSGVLSSIPCILQAAAHWGVSLFLASVTQVTNNQHMRKLCQLVCGSVPLLGYGYIF